MWRTRWTPLLIAGVLGVLPGLAQAGLFDDDEARARVEQLRTRVGELNTLIESVNRNQVDFANQVESIRAEIARINGQVEVMRYQLESAQKRQQDFYVDLDSRLRKLETAAEKPAEAAPKVNDAAAETRDYETALTALKASQYKEAGASFVAFMRNYPQSNLVASANYWGAYAFSQAKDFSRAAELFGAFANGWPDDERAPDALESQAASLEMLKDAKTARLVLERLATKYPQSSAGKKAQQRLKKK